MTRTVRTLVSCALLALVAKPERDLHAQSFNSCVNGSATQETDLTKFELYKMFDDLFLRPDGGRAPTNSTYLIGNALQRVGGTGRYLPAYGKCDPQTDESIMFIRQIIPTGTPIVSGGATGGGGGSAGGTASRLSLGSSRADDEVIVGYVDRGDGTPFHAFRWTLAGGVVDLGTLDPVNNATSQSIATATNADATVVVGISEVNAHLNQHAFRWTSAGMVDLGTPTGATRDSRATAVSAAGDVIVGDATFADASSFTGFRSGAFRWTSAGGFRDLGTLDPGFFSIATRVSADGNIVIGQAGVEIRNGNSSTNGSKAFRWTNATGIQPIGPLSGHTHAIANGVSDNGKVIVGISSPGPLSYDAVRRQATGTAFIWTESAGIKELRQVLVDRGFQMTGVTLVTAVGISADGQYIIGDAIGPRTPSGETRPYIIKLCDAANGVPCTPLNAAPVAATFALTTTSASITSVKAGENVTSTLTVTPSGGFNQAVTFSCSGLPATTACAFAPSTLTPTGAALSTTLTIMTTAPTRAASGTIIHWSGPATAVVAASVALLVIFGLSTRPRRQVTAAAAMAAVLLSCGGGGDDGGTTEPPLTGGTAAGTYVIVVTATSGSGASAIAKNLTITMTVTR